MGTPIPTKRGLRFLFRRQLVIKALQLPSSPPTLPACPDPSDLSPQTSAGLLESQQSQAFPATVFFSPSRASSPPSVALILRGLPRAHRAGAALDPSRSLGAGPVCRSNAAALITGCGAQSSCESPGRATGASEEHLLTSSVISLSSPVMEFSVKQNTPGWADATAPRLFPAPH